VTVSGEPRKHIGRLHPVALGLVLAILVLVLSNCQSLPPPPPVVSPPGPDSLWGQRLQDRALEWQRSQVLYRVSITSPSGKASARALVTAQLPDRVRIEAGSIWGQTYGVLTREPGQARLWLGAENKFYLAEDSELMLERLLGIPIPAEALIQLLLACADTGLASAPPVLPGAAAVPGHWQPQVEAGALVGISAEYRGERYLVSYEPALSLSDTGAPRRIRLETRDWRLQAEVLTARHLDEIDPNLFQLAPPAGAETTLIRARP